jgi:hypothetical protein
MQLRACLGDFVVKLLPKTKVEVFVTSIQQELVRSVAATVDRGFTQLELSKAFDVLLRQAGRQKPELDQLHRQMQPFFNKGQAPTTLPSEHPILVIWSKSSENFYRVIA